MTNSPPPLSYASPDSPHEPMRPASVFAGVAVALLFGPGVSFGGLGLGIMFDSGNYAGVGGWLLGTIVAGVLTLGCFLYALFHIRSPSGRRRGFALGSLIGVGLTLLTFGLCLGISAF